MLTKNRICMGDPTWGVLMAGKGSGEIPGRLR